MIKDIAATWAVQDAVTWILAAEEKTTVAEALIRIIQAASHDLEGYAEEMR